MMLIASSCFFFSASSCFKSETTIFATGSNENFEN